MLIDLLFNAISSVIGPLLSAIPTATLPFAATIVGQENPDQRLGALIGMVDNYVPVIEQLRFLGLLLTFFAALLGFKLAVFAWHLVRG